MIATLALLAALVSPTPTATPTAAPIVVDVVISAGHEGRPESCPRFPKHKCNLGAPGERQWTPIVADAATRVLRAHGVTVARLPADFDGTYDVGAAVFIHFDGNDTPCSTGASIGYHRESDRPAAAAWRAIYSHYFPYAFMPDDFTRNLRDYYGFRQVRSADGAIVIELGEVTCPREKAWLAPRLEWEGALIAYYLSQRIGKGDVPDPGPFVK